METIHIKFNARDKRQIIANGMVVGDTDMDILIPANYYQITLSGNRSQPLQWQGQVAQTTQQNPLIIVFTPN
jgi:hypothetical protein